jgi:hypothetical protein
MVTSIESIAQHDDPLDRRQTMAARVGGEVGVGLGGKVAAPAQLETGGLDVESAVLRPDGEHAGREALAFGVETERGLDGGDALVEPEQLPHVATGQDQRLAHRVAARRLKDS